MKVYNRTIPIGAEGVVVALDAVSASNLPAEVDTVMVLGLNVFGQVVDLRCKFGQREMTCGANLATAV